jgi:hypothetical protein
MNATAGNHKTTPVDSPQVLRVLCYAQSTNQLRSKLDGTLPTSILRATMMQNNCENSPFESWSTGTQLVV